MLFYYESNERDTIRQRVITTVKTGLMTFLIILAFFLGTSIFARNVWVPRDEAETLGEMTNIVLDGTPLYSRETSLEEHIMISAAFIGNMFYVVFTGIGLVALPWDLFVDY